jgi:excisionase family DNA binding protein
MATARGAPVSRQVKPTSVEKTVVPTDAVFTIDELAAYLKLPKRTLYKLVQEGTIPGHKVGRHWRFKRDTIDRWLDGTAPSAAQIVEINANS